MYLINLLNDEYISYRKAGHHEDHAFHYAMDNVKEYIIANYSEQIKKDYFDLKNKLMSSHAITQKLELNYKLKCQEIQFV